MAQNVDAAEDAAVITEGERQYVTAEVMSEAEGSLLTGGPTLRPVYSIDGTPWVRSKQSVRLLNSKRSIVHPHLIPPNLCIQATS